ncbi:hypothetical protein AGABI2DRAFT_145898 [Agaricus bisporus var. bisporus H97]|uniref:hypothetical protein n=1 Tax=Agaricus bisporus var. bisporus (strain H97 / ATCC MYA-4626 / FGSC 10389) TaxID=936046 RepID=UPI00029F5F8E|nr:hypothetical protein AGABI2DRAFT_145898 [Agaricus bisporus var. bisporus H97]EKV43670.1 hypothetical protein AGABI2DRAFT_145898 [Agaricus bisporus var. bisporus H97]
MTPLSMALEDEVNNTLGAAFFTFICGCVLYGITLSQVYQYFRMYPDDVWSFKATRWLSKSLLMSESAKGVSRLLVMFTILDSTRAEFLLDFASGAKWVLYFAFGVTCVVDIGITVGMCAILTKSRVKVKGVQVATNVVLSKIIIFFISSGLLTTLVSIVYMVLYSSLPDVLLFIGATFSSSKLYANSALAMLNGRRHLRSQLARPYEFELHHSTVHFRSEETSDLNQSISNSNGEKIAAGRFRALSDAS